MDSFSHFIFNVFVNSFLAFFTAVIIVEAIIFLFRIKQGRLVSMLRMVSILKLPLDLFLYDFTKWSYLSGVDPLVGEEGTRTLSITLGGGFAFWEGWLPLASKIEFTILGDKRFTVADMLSGYVPREILPGFACCLMVISVGCVLYYLGQYYHFVSGLPKFSDVTYRVHSARVRDLVFKNGINVIISSRLEGSPFVVGISKIYVPKKLMDNLSRKEFEAVLGHELEHIRYRDNFVRFVLNLISAVFWWIPMRWLQRLIEEGQEVSCDSECRRSGINPVDLAAAICKSVRGSLGGNFAYHLAKSKVEKRVNFLLHHDNKKAGKMKSLFCMVACVLVFFIVFLGRFWIF